MADLLSISAANAAPLSNNYLVEGIIENIVTYDEWIQHLPWIGVENLSYTINREATSASVGFASASSDLNVNQFQTGITVGSVNISLSVIVGDILMGAHIEEQLADANDQLMVQIAGKAKEMARVFMNQVVNGRTNTSSLTQYNNGYLGMVDRFDGLQVKLDAEESSGGIADDTGHPFASYSTTGTQTRALVEDDPASSRYGRDGRAYSLEDLDELKDCITIDKPDFLMMNSREIRQFKMLMRTLGGVTPEMVMNPAWGKPGPMLNWEGIPIFRNDFISVVDGVELIASGVFTQVSATICTVAGSGNLNADAATVAGIAASSLTLMIRTIAASTSASPYQMIRYPVSAASDANPSQLTATTTSGTFFDPERDEVVTRANGSHGFDDTDMGSGVQTAYLYERIDGSAIYCGCWGEFRGICGFTSKKNAGITLTEMGQRQDAHVYQYRLAWYVGFDNFQRLALARIKNVLPPS